MRVFSVGVRVIYRAVFRAEFCAFYVAEYCAFYGIGLLPLLTAAVYRLRYLYGINIWCCIIWFCYNRTTIASRILYDDNTISLLSMLSIDQQYDVRTCMSMVRLLSQRCTNSVVPNSCIVWHPIQRRIVSSGYTTIGCSCEDHALSHLSWWVSRNCWIIFNY